jgi:hopanoid biosynthesis associated RND transporter like protein HpnN
MKPEALPLPLRALPAALAGVACRRPRLVALLLLALGLAAALHVARHFAIDTDVGKLFPADLPWRQTERALAEAFPQREDLVVVVVDGPTPDGAERATAALAAALEPQTDVFRSVRRPDAGPFFERSALLYLPPDALRQTTERLIEAQPLIGILAADPSLRGVAAALRRIVQGAEQAEGSLAGLAEPLAALATAAEASAAVRAGGGGGLRPLDWSALFAGSAAAPRAALRRFVLVHPRLDFAALSPGAAAGEAIRAAARRLGLAGEAGVRVRLTGPVALADEEFATVAEGAARNTLLAAALETTLLWLALRSARLILPVLATVLVGLAVTAAFGLLAFGSFNIISVAFAVLFIGLGDDQSVQFAVRYREERHALGALEPAVRAAGRGAGPAMALAALAIAAGFYALAPTDYRGVSELGVIAGTGMLLAWLLSLTLLPALVRLARPPGEPAPLGYRGLAPLDAWLRRRARGITAAAGALALACAAAAVPRLAFDFNPMHLRDPRTEAVATLRDLMRDPETTPNGLDMLAPDLSAAVALAARLEALPEVSQALTLRSFVPDRQDEKLALIADAATLIAPGLLPGEQPPVPPDEAEVVAALTGAAAALEAAAGSTDGGTRGARGGGGSVAIDDVMRRLAAAFRALAEGPPDGRARLEAALLPGLRTTLRQLAEALQAGPVGLEDLPPDLVRDWIAPDGRARVQVAPRDASDDNATLRRFAAAVQALAPAASGAPVSIQAASRTILHAFLGAGLIALVLVTALLALALRDLRLTAVALAPLVLAGLLTAATSALVGPALNLANIIALPLLFGIGVAFDVYYVAAWQAGRRELLGTGLTRAVLFSTLTTLGAFGTLALSSHPGTASMGVLLMLSLFYILAAVLLTLPAMLHALAGRG